MKRLVVAAATALVFAAPAFASEQHPTQGELESELVCPQCHEPLDESSSPIAAQMKAYIRAHIAMGWTKSHIVNSLEGPPNNLGPAWTRNKPGPPASVGPMLDPLLERRVDEELAQFDG